ncbi:MAG: zinc-dependent metalloprotease, partial [Myxococcaceae bacterium]|nr:zinc-dependent metalloprotease [Myxococcaceae bacterium]
MKRALWVVVLAAACGEPIQPRSTVQQNALSKRDFDGVWYFRQTVVGVPFATGFTFPGEQGENEMEKVVWDIQENVLVARRAYEFVRGSEKGNPAFAAGADRRYQGAPVAAFRITSHFDIIREYNASTGEEFDKLIESQERKWFERAFFRVDWSKNEVTNFNFLADWSAPSIQPIKQDPVGYSVSDPNDPDAFRLERTGDEPASYLEVTQKLVASPEQVTFEDGTSWPLCWLEYSTADCASQEIRVRNAFLRARPRDYEPRVYDDKEMERFGFFSTERRSYNRQYGLTESGRDRFINRHNQWWRSLTNRPCQLDAHCGPSTPGQRCVTELPDARVEADGKVTGVCSLPYAVRNRANPDDPASVDLGPRPIVYYLNQGFPDDLKAAAQELERQYDAIFRDVVEKLQGRPVVGKAFVLCLNNPVREGDPAACGQPGTTARIGDVRFNLLYWVDEPVSAGLLGYGPNSNDAETGETVASSAFVYGAQIDTYAAMGRDLVRLLNGELQPDQFIRGVNVRDWVAAQPFGAKGRSFSQRDVDAMADAMDLGWTKGLPKTPRLTKGPARQLKERFAARTRALAGSQALDEQRGLSWRRLWKVQGTDVARRLMTPEVMMAHGLDPRAPLSKAQVAALNPANRYTAAHHALKQQQRRRLGAHAVDLAHASLNDAILGFALGQKGADPQLVWRRIREQVFLSTALHEVGHTLGLRHNFAGSYDPMNYPKTFWDLRTNNGTKAPKPRYLDPESEAELRGVTAPSGLKAGISEFMQSSIMDYGANFNSDIQGLGRYDRAALKFGYGSLVEVFETTRNAYLLGSVQAVNAYGDALPLLVTCDGNDYTSLHYTKLPQVVDLERRSDVPFAEVRRKEVARECAYPDLVEVDARDRLLVPYKFCSDEFEGASTGCEAFDRGADVYEVAEAKMSDYRSYYLFDAFRRERLDFSPWAAMDHAYWRYFDSLRTMTQFYVLNRAAYADTIPDEPSQPDSFWRSPDKWGPYTVAVTKSFDFFGDVLMTPEPGPYDLVTQPDGRDLYMMDELWERPKFRVPLG